MSNIHNGFVLKSASAKTASEIASDIFQGTFVESAYDKEGKFSHLLARLPQSEFIRLYSPQTTASIFIQGHWLQLSLLGKQKKILNRDTKVELTFEINANAFGYTELIFYRFEKRVARFKYKKQSPIDFLTTENGFHSIARAAVKLFSQSQLANNLMHQFSQVKLPVVIVLMYQEKQTLTQFDSSKVLIQ
jgi:hypothetical protein